MYLEASEKGFFFKNQTTVSADRPTLKGVAKSIPLGNKKGDFSYFQSRKIFLGC